MADSSIHLRIGPDELVVRRRYETLSIVNDFAAAVLFLVGSVLFFSESTMYSGTWLFVIGSVLFCLRPTIRLSRRIHLQRRHGDGGAGSHESSMDF
ncbi:YrhK family protein [Actinomadura welshii]